MEKLMILLLLCHEASTVKHSLRFHAMISSGNPNIPDYMAAANFEEVEMAYYDSNMKTPEPRHALMRILIEIDRHDWEGISKDGINHEHLLRVQTDSFKQHSNQTGGVHIIQQMLGCDWDDETEKVIGYNQYGYNGEDFLTFDLETETWIAANPQAETTKQEWDGNTANNKHWKNIIINVYPFWLKKYLIYASGFLGRPELPSVSLLQKTPSSPVSCHATGFYPHRAVMFWRKDGEDLHEDVDQGEILPNNDDTFQVRVDLDISSVTPEDWRRYDCVFQLSGVKEDVVTKLDKAVIRTNEVPPSEFPAAAAVSGVVVGLLLLALCGLFIWRRKHNGFRPANTSDSSFPLDAASN
ncbi:major histocompatibility complex class I-related gene protein-like [Seriola aureovittata]|uniref:major histocompatibility complex class I-related gene protein-like n=1 Tax=Seriola aureovittata TaxID=2871759 RepID=UPI0024BD8B15|nr:major histocompatibility complex class I-related gene protein-like [Seriola aureovittata]